MNTEKRIYSMNVVAWLRSHGQTETYREYDGDAGCFYWVFSEGGEVGKWIKRYRTDSELQSFLGEFRKLKEEVKQLVI